MTFKEQIIKRQRTVNSLVCCGLDTDKELLPKNVNWQEDPVLAFNKAIIDATAEFVCSFKINIAFYLISGWLEIILQDTIKYIHEKYPEIPVILDTKDGDIANSAQKSVQKVFERFKADAVTINPLSGRDSCQPFLDQKEKGIFILCRTSNANSEEFQCFGGPTGPLWKYIAYQVVNYWNNNNNCGLVIGGTYPSTLKTVRQIAGDMPILVPGIGAQEGDLESVVFYGLNSFGQGLIISASRSIIYASNGPDFAEAAARATKQLRDRVNQLKRRMKR